MTLRRSSASLLRETDATELLTAVEGATRPFTSALAIFESSMAIAQQRGVAPSVARQTVKVFLIRSQIEVRPVDEHVGDLAIEAHERYGRGRDHRATLNFGDCFAYGMAKAANVGLIYKGHDFALTDLA